MTKSPRKKRFFPTLGWALFLVVILVFVVVFIFFKVPISKGFVESGDKALRDKRFVTAIIEYRKAQFLIDSDEIDQKLELANSAQKDILLIETKIYESGDEKRISLFNQAKEVPNSEYEAVVTAKKMIEANEPMFGIIASNTAIMMNRDYMDAWLYLGISHLETSIKIELNQENRNYHQEKAKDALLKAKQIDPENEVIDQYLNQIK